MTIFMCTILAIPISLPSIVCVYCTPGDMYNDGHVCYQTFHIFLVFSSLVNLIWLIVIHLIFSLFYFNRNPFTNDIFSMSLPTWNLVKFFIKVTPGGYSYLDSAYSYVFVYVLGLAGCYIFYIMFGRYLYPYQRYNKTV